MSHSDREALALATIQFRKINRGRDIYAALIYITGNHYGSVQARRGGPYEAYSKTNRLIAVADSLSDLREKVVEVYAAEGTAKSAPAAA